MGQAVVHEYTSRQREYLSFVLQAPERAREHKPVVVAPEIRASAILSWVVVVLEAEALVVYQPFPSHFIFYVAHSANIHRSPSNAKFI